MWYASLRKKNESWNRVGITILFGVPLVLALGFLGFFSYPYFWDYSKTKPSDNDLFGSYRVLKLRLPSKLKREANEKEAGIILNADRTATLADVPEFNGFREKLESSTVWIGNLGTR